MKPLITDELKKRFAEIGKQQGIENPIVVAKFYDPTGAATWYATAYDPELNHCEGYVTDFGYGGWDIFSIDEIEALEMPDEFAIERDDSISEIPLFEMMKRDGHEALIEEIQLSKFLRNENEQQTDLTR